MTVVLRLSGGEVIVLLAAATNELEALTDAGEVDGYPADVMRMAIEALQSALSEIEVVV